MSDDNWMHRSSRMCCGTCMWWIQKIRVVPPAIPTQDPGKLYIAPLVIGRCRKNAPTIDGWPAVWETDWCGEHKIDENKV